MKYKIPFVNYGLQYKNLKKEIDEEISRVLESGDLILRKDVSDFEKNLADFVDAKYAVALNSGTDALFFSLLAAGIGKGSAFVPQNAGLRRDKDEVITVSHTFVASIAAIVQAGAKPILVDVKEDDYLMDMDKVEKAITKRTKAIIPVYLNGRMCDMDKLMEIARKYNLVIIEDAAQALGAKYKFEIRNSKSETNSKFKIPNSKSEWRNAGSIGLTGCFSFYPAKILGCFGDGGALTTNNLEVAEKIRLLRDHGQKTKTQIKYYGWNSRLDNLQAAVLNIKIKHLLNWIKRRREIAEIYNKGLSGIKEIKLPHFDFRVSDCENNSEDGPNCSNNTFDVFQNYVIRVKNRDKLYNYLKDSRPEGAPASPQRRGESLASQSGAGGVETLIKDPIPNHWQEGLHLSKFKLPITEKLSKEVISLPMYPELTDEQVEYVIECLRDFYK